MEKAKVYWADFRTTNSESLMQKLVRLVKKAGIETIDFDGKFTAIKLHFGEPGNLAYLRPNYARALSEFIKTAGGRPFLTDCNTLYPGLRKKCTRSSRRGIYGRFRASCVRLSRNHRRRIEGDGRDLCRFSRRRIHKTGEDRARGDGRRCVHFADTF